MVSKIKCIRVRPDEPFAVPRAHRPGDVGWDLTVSRYAQLAPGAVAHLSTNVAAAMPTGSFGLVLPRSSTMWHKGLHVSPGIVDSGYRGEIMVVVHNPTNRHVVVNVGERVAQLLVLPLWRGTVEQVDALEGGSRGDAGFGSTGGYDD
jgi:dUTP pyrophosphatase